MTASGQGLAGQAAIDAYSVACDVPGLRSGAWVTPEGDADPFRTEYARLLQESPDVVLAHASAVGALRNGKRDATHMTSTEAVPRA